MMTQKRMAFRMKVYPEKIAEYKKRHDKLWPELHQLLTESGISEYSIFHDKETNYLFAYQIQSGEQSSQDLGQTEIVKKWWDHMADIMETNPDNSPVSIPLEEVFYMK